jgi:hypothetical protein
MNNMKINIVYDIRLNIKEYETLNKIVELKSYLLSCGQEMILMLTEENLDYITEQLEDYLYSEDSIRGSEMYRQLSEIYYNLELMVESL